MHTEADIGEGTRPGLSVSAGGVVGVAVALAVGTSTIVFSEPALSDVLMIGVMVGVPLLGVGRLGRVTTVSLVIWLAIVALGIAGMMWSASFETGIKHQLVTLYLAGGAVALAGYVAGDPEPRMRLVLIAYVAACLVATAAAFAGYFRLLPGAWDLFTGFGRARGTFKDPNVYGAALGPAIVACAWVMLRENSRRALIAGAVLFPLLVGLLISFSRGAWVATVISLVILGGVAFLTSRRRSDFKRLGRIAGLGTGAVIVALLGVLQIEQVRSLLEERASLDQSYDQGPEGRFGGQAKARRLIADNPLGIGTHTFRTVHHKEEPHNVYFSMFLNSGWLGGLLYIVMVAATLTVGLRDAWRRTALQGPMLIATAAFAGLAFEGYVIDSDHWRSFFIVLGCIWGLADAEPPLIDPSHRRDDPTP